MLSPSQSLALEILDAGGTHQEAAKAAGVDRTTVSRWATKHPAFVSEMNLRKRERAEETIHRVSEVTLAALDCVAHSVSEGNVRAAIQWLRHFGLGPVMPMSYGPTTSPEYIEWRRRMLSPVDDLTSQVDIIEGRTTERALDVIIEELDD
jgi:hypothetical protein